ncbi:MAG: CPBP family glutamic-type intramembrane protease [Candidatus Asgardarchaeia archaeon]
MEENEESLSETMVRLGKFSIFVYFIYSLLIILPQDFLNFLLEYDQGIPFYLFFFVNRVDLFYMDPLLLKIYFTIGIAMIVLSLTKASKKVMNVYRYDPFTIVMIILSISFTLYVLNELIGVEENTISYGVPSWYLIVVGPFQEELTFRLLCIGIPILLLSIYRYGFDPIMVKSLVFGKLSKDKFSNALVVLSSLNFCLAHFLSYNSFYSMISSLFGGIFLGLIFIEGGFLSSYLLHSVWNSLYLSSNLPPFRIAYLLWVFSGFYLLIEGYSKMKSEEWKNDE